MRTLSLLSVVSVLAAGLAAQDNPQVSSAKAIFELAKTNVLKSAEKMPEEKYSFRPAPDVRTYGQLLAHVADGQYFFCGVVKEGKGVSKGVEKSATTKSDIVAALREAFAYCDGAYSGLTDAGSAAMITFLGQPRTKLSILSFNSAHTFEHYGNVVTYLRMNGIVPPSSEGQAAPPPPAKK